MCVCVCVHMCVRVWAFMRSGVCLPCIVFLYELILRAYIAILDITSIMIIV